MPALASLAHMELNGFGFSDDECEKQRKIIIARLDELEQEAYRLAGRNFALTSPDDVCQVWIRRKSSSCRFLLSPLKAFIYTWATSAAYSLEINTFFIVHEPPAVNKVIDWKDAYS